MKIKKNLREFSPYDLDGSIDSNIEFLSAIKDKYPGYETYTLDFDSGYDSSGVFTLWGEREENKEDVRVRLEAERKKSESELEYNAKTARQYLEKVKQVNSPEGVALYEELVKIVTGEKL